MNTDRLEAYISGELPPQISADVERALQHDEELRSVYLKQKKMDAALQVLLTGRAEVDTEDFSKAVIARLESEGGDFSRDRAFSKSVLTEIIEEKEKIVPLRWPDLLKSAAVAAVAAFIVMAAMQMIDLDSPEAPSAANETDKSSPPNKSRAPFLARIESSVSAVWARENASIRGDGWISNGVFEIESGVAEIAFNSGAKAFIEGPARLSVESDNRAFLEAGKLTAEVSEVSTGFTINTPRMNIVDIGTRFGVSVADSGDTEVHVMEGVVEASRSSGNSASVILREGLALRADSRTLSALEPVFYSGDQFSLHAGESPATTPVLRYQFDESGGAELRDTGNSQKGGTYDLSLLRENFDLQPKRAPGFNGRCLVFEHGQSVSTPLSRDFRLEDPFTISFRIKLPPELGRKDNDRILSLGREGIGWEIGCQHNFGLGAVYLQNGSARVVGSTDLADGKWHHVAIRFIGGNSAQMGTHVHLYVDGKIETISDWNNEALNTGRAGEFRIGGEGETGFYGWIDDVSVFDEAISTHSIQKLIVRP